MAIKSGFFNSEAGDRKYDAEDFNKFFDGVITEGVLEIIGDTLLVIPSSGLQIAIGSGKAWFLKSWIENTSDDFLTLSDADVTFDRIDIIALDFDKSDQVRENRIVIVEGTPAGSPSPPSLIDTATHLQMPLAHILVEANETVIQAGDITNKVGTVDCPFSTGITDLVVSVDDVTIEIVSNDLQVKDDGITGDKLNVNVADDSTVELIANLLRVKDSGITGAKIGNDQINSQHYAAASIDNEHLANAAVDTEELAADAVDGTKIANNSINSEHYVDGSIDPAHFGDDAVDDTKVGNRVIQFKNRRGGSATHWDLYGTTNFVPGTVRMMAGIHRVTLSSNWAQVDITLPFSFSYKPLCFCSLDGQDTGLSGMKLSITPLAVNQIRITAVNPDVPSDTFDIAWFVIGPE